MTDGMTDGCSTRGIPKAETEKTRGGEGRIGTAVVPKITPSWPTSASETLPPDSHWAVSAPARPFPLQEGAPHFSQFGIQNELDRRSSSKWNSICCDLLYIGNMCTRTCFREDQKDNGPNQEGESVCLKKERNAGKCLTE